MATLNKCSFKLKTCHLCLVLSDAQNKENSNMMLYIIIGHDIMISSERSESY